MSLMAAAPFITARLREEPALPGNPAVIAYMDASDAGTVRQSAPCVIVNYGGLRVLETARSGRAARVETTWTVTVAVEIANSPAHGEVTLLAAQPLADAVLRRLMGFTPGGKSTPLELADLPSGARPAYRGGVLRIPLAFRQVVVVQPAAN